MIELSGQYKFDDALVLLDGLMNTGDPRFEGVETWAADFNNQMSDLKQQAIETAEKAFGEAKTHQALFDYSSAISALETIPPPLLTPSANTLLRKMRRDRQESNDLIFQIKERLQDRKLDGLIPVVEKAINLRGDRKDLRSIADKLKIRDQKIGEKLVACNKAAKQHFVRGDVRKAHELVKSLPLSKYQPAKIEDHAEFDLIERVRSRASCVGKQNEFALFDRAMRALLSYEQELFIR
ncbi:MAG: hypothetical protein GY818_15975 [Planctomycetaceae bacterium]|nr:hypothetical protein [Planctomycetaceae bacterium]